MEDIPIHTDNEILKPILNKHVDNCIIDAIFMKRRQNEEIDFYEFIDDCSRFILEQLQLNKRELMGYLESIGHNPAKVKIVGDAIKTIVKENIYYVYATRDYYNWFLNDVERRIGEIENNAFYYQNLFNDLFQDAKKQMSNDYKIYDEDAGKVIASRIEREASDFANDMGFLNQEFLYFLTIYFDLTYDFERLSMYFTDPAKIVAKNQARQSAELVGHGEYGIEEPSL